MRPSPFGKFVLFEDSVELCKASGVRLMAAGVDHRLNCEQGRRAYERAFEVVIGENAD